MRYEPAKGAKRELIFEAGLDCEIKKRVLFDMLAFYFTFFFSGEREFFSWATEAAVVANNGLRL